MCAVAAGDNRLFGPRFDVPVPADGYRWWYVDGISADGRCGIVVIAFVGSVFSPYYFNARKRGGADPENHVAINVGLYGPRRDLWAMTERGRGSLEREVEWFRVGPSGLAWRDGRLDIDIRERSAPLGRAISGRVLLEPHYLNGRSFPLDLEKRHRWRPIAPAATISVEMQSPSISWQGHGYFDTNAGERSLESDFERWNWSRGEDAGATSITYAVTQRDGAERALALHFDKNGNLSQTEVPPQVSMPRTGWRIDRPTRSASAPVVQRTLEDTPFYSRSLLTESVNNQRRLLMHESLALHRFRSFWVRMLLPFRMPRLR